MAAVYIGAQAVTGGLAAAGVAAAMGVALFGSVALHELGHAWAASRFGISTRSITLYPFGGIAALEREPQPGRQEAVIALAGPAVNLALAAVALPLALAGVAVAWQFLALNLVMGAFNLLPAFPMDGGRVLRSLLARRRGAANGTAVSLKVSRAFAWAFMALGVFTSPSLLLVGVFLHWMIRGEWRRLAARAQQPTQIPPGSWSHPAV